MTHPQAARPPGGAELLVLTPTSHRSAVKSGSAERWRTLIQSEQDSATSSRTSESLVNDRVRVIPEANEVPHEIPPHTPERP
jgi:hypothetical protein